MKKKYFYTCYFKIRKSHKNPSLIVFFPHFCVCCFQRWQPLCADHQGLGVTLASTTVISFPHFPLTWKRKFTSLDAKNQFPQSFTFFHHFQAQISSRVKNATVILYEGQIQCINHIHKFIITSSTNKTNFLITF